MHLPREAIEILVKLVRQGVDAGASDDEITQVIMKGAPSADDESDNHPTPRRTHDDGIVYL